MAHKELKYDVEARRSLEDGVNAVLERAPSLHVVLELLVSHSRLSSLARYLGEHVRLPQDQQVIAVGDGRYDEDGDKRIPLDVSEGDEVLYSKYGGTEIKVDGEDLLVLRESDVLAKVQS